MNGYYSRYANNLFLTYIFLNVYKIGEVIGIHNGYFLLLFIQSIMFSVCGFLIYKIADMYFKEKYKIFSICTWIIYMLIVGLSPHIVLTYSDGIGMFLSLILTYIIFKLEKDKDKDIKKDKNKINDDKEKNKLLQKSCISRIILILLFTNLSILGYYIKPQIIIISISYVIIKILNIPYLTYLVIKNKNKNRDKDEVKGKNIKTRKERIKKEIIYYIIVSILIIITGCIIYTHIRKANNSMGINVDKEKRFNITHYAMLGWNPESKGVFTIKDENFSGK